MRVYLRGRMRSLGPRRRRPPVWPVGVRCWGRGIRCPSACGCACSLRQNAARRRRGRIIERGCGRGKQKPRPGRGSCEAVAYRLERNVVVATCADAGLLALEVGRVGGDVGLRSEAVLAGAVAAAEELHGVGDDLDRLSLGPVLRLPLTPVEPALNGHRTALREVGGAVLSLRAPHRDVEVVRLVLPFSTRALAAAVDRDAELADRGATGEAAQFGIAREVSGHYDRVDVRRGHLDQPFLKSCDRLPV